MDLTSQSGVKEKSIVLYWRAPCWTRSSAIISLVFVNIEFYFWKFSLEGQQVDLWKGDIWRIVISGLKILYLSNLNIVHNRLTIELILNAHNILQYKQDLQHSSRIASATFQIPKWENIFRNNKLFSQAFPLHHF